MLRSYNTSRRISFLSNLRWKPFVQHSQLLSSVGRANVNLTHTPVPESQSYLLSEKFLVFLRQISGEFQPEFRKVLKQRAHWQKSRDLGEPLALRSDTAWIRNDVHWRGPPIVPELEKRWVEITGPAGDAKMMINALNSGANGYMADLEDSQSPDWLGIMQGHHNLYEAVRGTLSFTKNDDQKYAINANPCTLHVRVRGMHMFERHMVDESGRPIPASLFDMAMYLYHNVDIFKSGNIRPLLYVPKLESYEEASLIHDVIKQIETNIGLQYGTVRVTALIETLPGILEAEEIGFALGPYWAGLNCGRWDYIFSVLKGQATNKTHIFPDRSLLTMNLPFLTSYMQRIVQVCHHRGVHAMGGMSAFIPAKDAAANEQVMKIVMDDKNYEIAHGCDGAWVAHPAMVPTIQKVFDKELNGRANQIDSDKSRHVVLAAADFVTVPPNMRNVTHYTEKGLRNNISVGIQYISAWLQGTGAVAINGLMEDMATAEISRLQVWQWLFHKQELTFADGSVKPLDQKIFDSIFHSVVAELMSSKAAGPFLEKSAELFRRLVDSNGSPMAFIQDEGYELLNENVQKPELLKDKFVAYQFSKDEIVKLQGSRPDLLLDAKLTIARGEDFNHKMKELRDDGLVAHGSFIGTPNGHSARNVVEGGLGYSWPYVGGWELNARGLVGIEQPMPDTLSVNFHEQGDLARVITRFLDVADKVKHLELHEKLNALQKLPEEARAKKIQELLQKAPMINYLTQPMLADLEQGWGDPKKVFHAVLRCIEHGVNIMHIEDQYSLKRCGHLGGKGLDDIHGWINTMKSANLAASLFAGIERNGGKMQNLNFVARTDALSAEFIQYSNHMHDPRHPDHAFIDWDRGFTADGRYLYLKKGKNPATGRKFGLEHSARRCAEIVKLGLASHVWMETPDANVSDAKSFISLVQEHVAPSGLFARGLYNHSPSFVWDVNFFMESQELAKQLGDFIATHISHPLENKEMTLERAHWLVTQYLKDHGDRTRGDYRVSNDYVNQILSNGLDLVRGETNWRDRIDDQIALLKALGPSLQTYKGQKELNRILQLGYRPLRHITNTLVAQRLKNFKDRLSDVGFEVHLCTLPLYPSDAYTASRLARGMTETGIHDFVINQRAARKYADATNNLTSFFHQRSTGTGYEVAINAAVGTSNTDILHGSTEHADQLKEQQLREQDTGPSTYKP